MNISVTNVINNKTKYNYYSKLDDFINLPYIDSNTIELLEKQTLVNFGRDYNLNKIGNKLLSEHRTSNQILNKKSLIIQKKYLNELKKKAGTNSSRYYSLLILSSQTILGDITTNLMSNLGLNNLNFKVGNYFLAKINMDNDKKIVTMTYKNDIFNLKNFFLYYNIYDNNEKIIFIYEIEINIIAEFKKNLLSASAEINWIDEDNKQFMMNINNYIDISDKYNDKNYDFFYYSIMLFKKSIDNNCSKEMILYINNMYIVLNNINCNEKLNILSNSNNLKSNKLNSKNCYSNYYSNIINHLMNLYNKKNYCFENNKTCNNTKTNNCKQKSMFTKIKSLFGQ